MDELAETVETLTARLHEQVDGVIDQMEWAEQEIEAAQRRHPEQADVLYHAFGLLVPRQEMGAEFVYRGYCRELLERVATGLDTRLGTDTEIALLYSEASLQAPLNTTAIGLYFRVWLRAFPDTGVIDAEQAAHYEALRGAQIDDLEAELRRKLTVAGRRFPADIECAGHHHGQPVTCRYAPTATTGRSAA